MRQGNVVAKIDQNSLHTYIKVCQGKKEAQTENMVEHQQES